MHAGDFFHPSHQEQPPPREKDFPCTQGIFSTLPRQEQLPTTRKGFPMHAGDFSTLPHSKNSSPPRETDFPNTEGDFFHPAPPRTAPATRKGFPMHAGDFFHPALDSRQKICYNKEHERTPGCGAVGSARRLGRRCRRFESCHSDQKGSGINVPEPFSLFTAGQFLRADDSFSSALAFYHLDKLEFVAYNLSSILLQLWVVRQLLSKSCSIFSQSL